MVDYKSIGMRIAVNKKSKSNSGLVSRKNQRVRKLYKSGRGGKAKISLARLYEIADCLNIDVAVLVSDFHKTNLNGLNPESDDIIKLSDAEQREFLGQILDYLNKKIKAD